MRRGYGVAGGVLLTLGLVVAGGEAWSDGMARATGLSGAQFSAPIWCSKLPGGKVSFRPALTEKGKSREIARVTGTVSGCSGSISQNGLTIAHGSLKMRFRLRNSSCAALGGQWRTPAATVTWTDTAGSSSAIQPTELTFSGVHAHASSKDQYSLLLGENESGGNGSFPIMTGLGIAIATAQTQTQLANQCGTSSGLAAAAVSAANVPPGTCYPSRRGEWWLCI
jgi:hypothetical protein